MNNVSRPGRSDALSSGSASRIPFGLGPGQTVSLTHNFVRGVPPEIAPPRGFSFSTTPALPHFHVVEIATSLGVGAKFDAIRVNQTGEVLGTINLPSPADQTVTDAEGNRRIRHVAVHTLASVWQNGSFRRLPVPAGFYSVIAGSINASGEVVGISMAYRRGRRPYSRIVLYDAHSHITDIGTLDPQFDDRNTNDLQKMQGVFVGAACLNNRGTLTALVGQNTFVRRADGAIRNLGAGVIMDVNDDDSAVGISNGLSSSAALWTRISGSQPPELTPLLPEPLASVANSSGAQLSMAKSVAECLNNNQQAIVAVSGQQSARAPQFGHITYFFSDNGKLRLIASMRGVQHDHIRINNAGDAVGFEDYDTDVHAFVPILFHRGKLYDLRPVAATDGWTITSARDINDKGQILAYGYRGEGSELESPPSVPLLLTPQ